MQTIRVGENYCLSNNNKAKQAATEWTPDCLQKWYNFDQNCLSKLLQLTMKPELHTGIFGIRDHSISQQWWPCDLLECFRFTLNQLTSMLWWFPQSFMVISWLSSEIWPKIGKNHHHGSFNNPTVMALWLTRKLQHYYELHQNSAQMISWKFHGHIFSR